MICPMARATKFIAEFRIIWVIFKMGKRVEQDITSGIKSNTIKANSNKMLFMDMASTSPSSTSMKAHLKTDRKVGQEL